jgi:hypothetical protein
MAMSDCETVEANKDALWSLMSQCCAWSQWGEDERLEFIGYVADFLLGLRDIKPRRDLPAQWKSVLGGWMRGMNAAEMAAQPDIGEFSTDAGQICLFVEDICGMRLPWGINSILSYLQQIEEERGDVLPPVCALLAAMVKYGVLSPVAACLVPFVDHNRSLAMLVASVCPYDCDRPDRIIAWFKALTPDDLVNAGLNDEQAARVVNARDGTDNTRLALRSRTGSVTVPVTDGPVLATGERLLITRSPDQASNQFRLLTLAGVSVGTYVLSDGSVPDWWDDARTQTTVTDIEQTDDGKIRMSLSLESL